MTANNTIANTDNVKRLQRFRSELFPSGSLRRRLVRQRVPPPALLRARASAAEPAQADAASRLGSREAPRCAPKARPARADSTSGRSSWWPCCLPPEPFSK